MPSARTILISTPALFGALACAGCTWRDGDTQRTLVLGLGVVSTTAASRDDDAAEATRTRAVGLVLMPDAVVLGSWTRHRLRIAQSADAQVEAIDDGDGRYRTLAQTHHAARRPACGLSFLSRRCLCPRCNGCGR